MIRFAVALIPILLIVSGTSAQAAANGKVIDSFPWIKATCDENSLILKCENISAGMCEIYELTSPPRVVIDIPDRTCGTGKPIQGSSNFDSIPILVQLRASCNEERTRIVLESKFPLYWEQSSKAENSDLEITFLIRFRQT
ncbi:MAG: hypothetical protein ABIC40_00575, partial [bacterium]